VRVEFDRHSLSIDGERRLIRAGSLHYFRLPAPDLWRDRITKMKAAGLNAVDLYYPWNYHSPSPGEYDFRGLRDVDVLHDMIEEAGLYLIARPGPYICAEIDLGGLPAWLLRDPSLVRRCRSGAGFVYSPVFMDWTREWFEQIVPRFAARPNTLAVQIENEYTVPAPLAWMGHDWVDLLVRWFGSRAGFRLARRLPRRLFGARPEELAGAGALGQANPYMQELYAMVRELGVKVPIFHNDLSATRGRQVDVDLLGVDRYPITTFEREWRDDPAAFASFAGDEAGFDAHRPDAPVLYPELQAGWYDGWGGAGYARIRDALGPEGIDAVTKMALSQRGTLWTYFSFCGGTTWGYMGSPDVYTSYDYGAPIAESGRTGARYEAVRRLNEFLERFEAEWVQTERAEVEPWCPEHFATRDGPTHRFVFLRNPKLEPALLPTPEAERSELAPGEHQVRVYGPDHTLVAVSPEPVRFLPPAVATPPALPRLERWTFSGVSPQLDPSYDDSSWSELPSEQVEHRRVDMDSLGFHHGFVWYRGTFQGGLDRVLLDARHCWSVWLNRQLCGAGDQFRNTHGVGADGARLVRVPLRGATLAEGRNTLVVLVESLGHNKDFADDGGNPRGIVRIDTGSTPIRWRWRGGLVRGEQGMNPIVAFEGVERSGPEEAVVLPHGWSGDPHGIGVYETRFRLEGIDPKHVVLGLGFDPGRGKANLYLNGHLIGRYWPERGPQRSFPLPWGVLNSDEENHLAIALWKRSDRAALGKVRLEVL
jgi:hypothetical protein